MINRFMRRSPYDLGLYTPPVEMMQKSMEVMQKQYEINYQLAENIKNQYIPSLPQDRALANDIQKKWATKIDDVVAKYKGNYAQASQDLRKLQSEIRDDLSPGGVASAITSNFASYQNWLKNQQDRLEKGKIIADDLNLANSYIMKKYQGIGNIDPVTGTYNKLQTEEVADYQDPNQIIDKVYKEFKPEKGKTAYTVFQNGLQTQVEKEYEKMDPTKLNNAFQGALFSDPKYINYIRQRAKFLGMTDQDAFKTVSALTQQRANALGYVNEYNTSKSERDPLSLINARAAADRANIKYKNDLDRLKSLEDFERTKENFIQYEDTQQGMQAKPVDPAVLKDWTMGLTGSGSSEVKSAGVMSGDYFISRSNAKPVEETDLTDFLYGDREKADKLLKAKNIDPVLFRQMLEDKVHDFKDEYAQKYGKDKEWTKKFDQDIFWDYQKETKSNHTMNQTYSYIIPDNLKKQVLSDVLRRSSGDNAAEVYIPGSNTTLQGLPEEIRKELFDEEKGASKSIDLADVRYVIPQAGYHAAGHKVVLPSGKSFVVVDQSFANNQLGKRLNRAIGSLFNEGLAKGSDIVDVPVVTEKGQVVVKAGRPVRSYERVDGKYQLALKYEDPKTGELLTTKVNNNGNTEEQDLIMNIPALMQLHSKEFNTVLGYQKQKGEITPYSYYDNILNNAGQ